MRDLPLHAIAWTFAIWWSLCGFLWYVGTRYRLERIDRLIEAERGREARRVMARLTFEAARRRSRADG